MDQSRLPSPTRAASILDHHLLIAGAAVRQAATRTAVLAEWIDQPDLFGDLGSALVALFTDGDGAGTGALNGSFHPRVASAPRAMRGQS